MKHGVLIDREYYERLEVFIRSLSDMGLVSSSVTTPVLKGMEIAISSAPPAVIPIEKKPERCAHCRMAEVFYAENTAWCARLLKTIGSIDNAKPIEGCPIITKE